jgi:hypothetical protein
VRWLALVLAVICLAGSPASAQLSYHVPSQAFSDDTAPNLAWNALRHALANDDRAAIRAALTPDAAVFDFDGTRLHLRAQGAAAVADLLAAETGAEAGTGVALLPLRSVRVDDVVLAAEALPRVYGVPARLSIYRTFDGRVLRVIRLPQVPRSAPSALEDVIDYRAAWSTGRWSEVSARHAPDVRVLMLRGVELSALPRMSEWRRCYEAGFRRWRALGAGPSIHPQTGSCDGGPITVERGVAAGPYVATVEKRMWASAMNEWSLRMFLYEIGDEGVRRVVYVLRW